MYFPRNHPCFVLLQLRLSERLCMCEFPWSISPHELTRKQWYGTGGWLLMQAKGVKL
jgi:hypothetical protein